MSAEHLTGFLNWLEGALATESVAAVADHLLVERFLASRDDSAFRVFVARHGPMVYRVCRRVLPDEQDAEDAFQATFVVLIRNAGSIRNRTSLASWLHGVAHQVSLRIRTGVRRRRVREATTRARNGAETPNELSWREARAILDEELAQLPERLRAPLVLCYLEGFTQDEAAEHLGQSKRTLRRCLERGRAVLGSRLTRRGLSLSAAMMTTLFSECLEAMPARLASATTALMEALQMGTIGTLSPRVSTVSGEVTKMMAGRVHLKWIAAGLLGVCLSGGALGAFLIPENTREVEPFQFVPGRDELPKTTTTPSPLPIQAKPAEDEKRAVAPQVIKAWEKAGATYGHFKLHRFGQMYFVVGPPPDNELPGFWLWRDSAAAVKLAELPAPGVPFGLALNGQKNWSDLATLGNLSLLHIERLDGLAGVKALAKLDRLQTLDFEHMRLSPSDLKELASLSQLQSLNIRLLRTTPAGIHELAGLKNLVVLNLKYLDELDEDDNVSRPKPPGRPVDKKAVKSAEERFDACVKDLAALTKL